MTMTTAPSRVPLPQVRQRRHMTLVAAGATLLSSLPLSGVFDSWSWLFHTALVVGVMCAIGLVLRGLRLPVWAPSLGMAGSLPLLLCWLYPSGV